MCPSCLVKPAHIDLLRRVLPFLKQTWVVDDVFFDNLAEMKYDLARAKKVIQEQTTYNNT